MMEVDQKSYCLHYLGLPLFLLQEPKQAKSVFLLLIKKLSNHKCTLKGFKNQGKGEFTSTVAFKRSKMINIQQN